MPTKTSFNFGVLDGLQVYIKSRESFEQRIILKAADNLNLEKTRHQQTQRNPTESTCVAGPGFRDYGPTFMLPPRPAQRSPSTSSLRGRTRGADGVIEGAGGIFDQFHSIPPCDTGTVEYLFQKVSYWITYQ